MCNLPIPNASLDISKPDYEQTAELIEFCGFIIPDTVMNALRTGWYSSVSIIPDEEGGPILRMEKDGYPDRVFIHIGKVQAKKYVRDKIEEFAERLRKAKP